MVLDRAVFGKGFLAEKGFVTSGASHPEKILASAKNQAIASKFSLNN